jgi:hypothetical protein
MILATDKQTILGICNEYHAIVEAFLNNPNKDNLARFMRVRQSAARMLEIEVEDIHKALMAMRHWGMTE